MELLQVRLAALGDILALQEAELTRKVNGPKATGHVPWWLGCGTRSLGRLWGHGVVGRSSRVQGEALPCRGVGAVP